MLSFKLIINGTSFGNKMQFKYLPGVIIQVFITNTDSRFLSHKIAQLQNCTKMIFIHHVFVYIQILTVVTVILLWNIHFELDS